ncbi:MAG: hypothetical protein SW833_16420 [Cyanobacteriota bacterium]|nr:hypothetical protein [Cyanobacteriota bacterium]
MKIDDFALAQNMAFLLAIPPNSHLAKLLSFCLAAKVRDKTSGTEMLKLTYDLMENPDSLPYWTQEIMGHDLDYTREEWQALGEMGIKNAEEFMAAVRQELENLKL